MIRPPTAASFTRSRAESDSSSPGSRWDEAAFKIEIQDKPRPALIQNGTRYLIIRFKRAGDNSSGDTDHRLYTQTDVIVSRLIACVNALILTALVITYINMSIVKLIMQLSASQS